MEDPEAEKVTGDSSLSPTEHSVDEKHPGDHEVPQFKESAGIIPQESAAGRSPLNGFRFHSPKPTEAEEADGLGPAAERTGPHSPSSSGEGVPVLEVACTGAEFNQLPPPPEDTETVGCLLSKDVFEPQSPLREAEYVLTFEAVQTREEPHGVPCADEDKFLASEVPFICTEHNAHVSLEGREASVPEFISAPAKDKEASTGLAQGRAEQVDGCWKEEKLESDTACVVGSEGIAGHEVEMAGDLVEAAVHEFTEEAVESSREDAEAAEEAIESAEDAEATGSGDIAYENEFSVVVDVKRRGGRKKKRGRPTSKLQGTRFSSQKKYEEEVCFICFDGGDLVVCDRRGCPKVYHPSCVNREEAYFQSKGQWSCGWHLCSKCQKSASYKCYTCTYSLCKLCVNEEEFTCIRGNKGFCTACLTTILLMETSGNSKETKDGVDFNDRSCWEYLFKDYWFELKTKLSMNLDELTKARTASKVCGLDSGNEGSLDDEQGASSDRSSSCHDESISSKKKLKIARTTTACKISRNVQSEGTSPPEDTSSRKRTKNQSRNATPDSLREEEKTEFLTVHQENSLIIKERKRSRKTGKVDGTVIDTGSELSVRKNNSSRKKSKRRSTRTDDNLLEPADEEQTNVSEYTAWASKELLEFVSHVRNGDKSILSPYEVQELLLDYIRVKKLRDRHKKSQIICDAMLLTLFNKSHVAHFEMLKLLESHFFIKASSPASDEKQPSDTDSIQMGAEVSSDTAEMMISEKRRMPRRRVEGKATDLYSYAAIDVHNISLMYLRRYLMEELIDDMSTFSEKVIGSFVRIRISVSSQRQEVYRLVQVVGCGKAPEVYKTGKRTTDVMLEIINLDKKEVITVDIISNQEFTEEECKRLRQSIKFGFISRLTVGEVEEKARVLQAVRVSERLESEKLRLTHLRDRASEKGRKKEHRECVEKLHLLSNPEEHGKRLDDVAQAHADPKMDPSYESPEDDANEDIREGNSDRTTQCTFKERELISPQKEGNSNWNGLPKISSSIITSPKKVEQISNVEILKMEAKIEPLSEQKEPMSELTVLPELNLEESSTKIVSQPNASENEKLWQYKDPSGKIQGPFSIVQLRKWSKHFPSNLVIWKKSERQENSILLTDALSGNFKNDLPEWVPVNSLHSSSQTTPIISSSKIQETSIQNDKAGSNATRVDSVSNLDNKYSTESNDFHKISKREQVSVHGLSAESNHQASYQLNRPPVVSSELDPRKKFLEEPATTLGNVNNTQEQNIADNLKSNRCSNHGTMVPKDKAVDHSTSSTESNTVPETSQCDRTRTRFNKGGESHRKPVIESNALESPSPQRSDTSTFTKPGTETSQSAYANTLIQIPATFINSASGQPSHPVPQASSSCNWSQLTNTIVGEQPFPSLNLTTTLSDVTAGVSTSVNCQIAPLVSSDGSVPFSSPQLNNSTSTVTYQPVNMSWGTANTEVVNTPGWQVQTQYPNLSNIAAAVGNLLCGTGVQGGLVNPSLGWGMMAQGNMNMPWVVPPNVNIAWNQGLTLPPQGNLPPNFIRPPPPTQGNVAPQPIWSGPVQANTSQIPSWPPAPVLANSNQIPHENNAGPRDSSKDTQSSLSVQRSRDGNFESRDGGFRGAGSGYNSGRQSRNWMGNGGGERPYRPHQEHTGICLFYRNGHCKKGVSCNFIHS